MTCGRIKAELDEFLDGDLPADERHAFESHVEACAACATVVANARALQQALAAQPVEAPSDGFFDRALARAALPPRRDRAARLSAAAFLGAFGLSILTVVLTGLAVRAPRHPVEPAADAVSLERGTAHTVNLLFESGSALDDVELSVDLPRGVEVRGFAGRRQIAWTTHLAAGNNLLPLELVAVDGRGGRLVARLRHAGKEKIFLVNVAVMG